MSHLKNSLFSFINQLNANTTHTIILSFYYSNKFREYSTILRQFLHQGLKLVAYLIEPYRFFSFK